MRSGDRESLSTNLVTEDAESAARVEIGSDDQNPSAFDLGQAFGRIVRLISGGEPENRTHPHRWGLGMNPRILRRQLYFVESEDLDSRWNIQHNASCIPLVEKLESSRRTVIRLSR